MPDAKISKIRFFELSRKVLYVLLIILCSTNFVSAPIALAIGLVFAMTIKSTFDKFNALISKYLLQFSVVGLGFGMNVNESLQAGSDGMLFTLLSVISVLTLGIIIGKWMGVSNIISYLISTGTAICGGSAIAAVCPIVKASQSEMSLSLATIFILNSIALFLFPPIGHFLNLSEFQFGVWSALAIHDTSSVVGAASVFGEHALKVATTVKLTRALWIIPVSIFSIYYFKSKNEKIQIPWFIFFFILAMIVNTYFSIPEAITHSIVKIARQLLTLTLFFIGAGLSMSAIKTVGVKPLLLGMTIWLFNGIISLVFLYFL
jgi:uncharacterized integral membrane protein (TIGR00698 family)